MKKYVNLKKKSLYAFFFEKRNLNCVQIFVRLDRPQESDGVKEKEEETQWIEEMGQIYRYKRVVNIKSDRHRRLPETQLPKINAEDACKTDLNGS